MSLHYEWTLSLRLRPDTPDVFVKELRYHLGLSDLVPQDPTLDVEGAALAPSGDGGGLAGGPSTSLALQQPTSAPPSWGVFARILVLDDAYVRPRPGCTALAGQVVTDSRMDRLRA